MPTDNNTSAKQGIYIALIPDYGFDKSLIGLDVHLVNGLETPIEYYYELGFNSDFTPDECYEGEVPAGDLLHMSHLYFGQLNENPSITVECQVEENSKHKAIERTIKLKAKSIFNGPKYSPVINEEAFVYDIYIPSNNVQETKKTATADSFKFDIELLKHSMTEKTVIKDSFHLSEAAYELDLHFEVLVKDGDAWDSGRKLQYQLDTFKQKLDNAIANGLHSMVVIHGVGSGRLKEEVNAILKGHPKIKSFGPPLHKKYGFGATEIYF